MDLHKKWTHRWHSPKVRSFSSPIDRIGVIAVQDIKKGEEVFTYGGIIIPTTEIENYWNELGHVGIQISDDFFIVPASREELETEGVINHSCSPNVGFKSQLELVAIRDIKEGEEITFDYAFCETTIESFECKCGTAGCRGKVTKDDWQLPEIRDKYLDYFSPYLKQEIEKSESKGQDLGMKNREKIKNYLKTILKLNWIALIALVFSIYTYISLQPISESNLSISQSNITFDRVDINGKSIVEGSVGVTNLGKFPAMNVSFKIFLERTKSGVVNNKIVEKLFDDSIVNPIDPGISSDLVSFAFDPEDYPDSNFLILFKVSYTDTLGFRDEQVSKYYMYIFDRKGFRVRPLLMGDYRSERDKFIEGLRKVDETEAFLMENYFKLDR